MSTSGKFFVNNEIIKKIQCPVFKYIYIFQNCVYYII